MKPTSGPLAFGKDSQSFDNRPVMSYRDDAPSSQEFAVEQAINGTSKTARKENLMITELPDDDGPNLYLQDPKYFMSLRNAQINFKNRRQFANQTLIDKKACSCAHSRQTAA